MREYRNNAETPKSVGMWDVAGTGTSAGSRNAARTGRTACKWRAAIIAAAIFLCACGNKSATQKTVSMYDLRIAMEAADDTLPKMENASDVEASGENNFQYISDMDYGKVESYFVSYAEAGTAEEIAVIVVENGADVREAEESLKKHQNDRYKLFEQYEPKETKRIQDGLVFSKGRYAVLIICDRQDAVREAFFEAIKQN